MEIQFVQFHRTIYDIKNFITWFPPIWYDKDIIYYNKLKQYIRIKVGTVHTKNPYKTNSISVEHKYNYYYFTSTNEDFYLEKFEENRDDL